MTYDGDAHVSLLAYPEIRDRLIVLDGWSKTYAMTGWRLGWRLAEAAVDAARRLAVNCHSCVNAATQYAGIAALNGPQDSVRDGRGLRPAPQDRVEGLNRLSGVSCSIPGGAFYAFPNITRTGWKARRCSDAARGGRRRDDRRHQLRRPRRGLSPLLLRQLGREHPARARADGRFPGDTEGGIAPSVERLAEARHRDRRGGDVNAAITRTSVCRSSKPAPSSITPRTMRR